MQIVLSSRRVGLWPQEPPAALTSPPPSRLDLSREREMLWEGNEAGVAPSKSWASWWLPLWSAGNRPGVKGSVSELAKGPDALLSHCSFSNQRLTPAP